METSVVGNNKMMTFKNIVLHCFVEGKIIDTIGDVIEESVEVDNSASNNSESYSIHNVVCKILRAFNITKIDFSTVQVYTYTSNSLVRILNTHFLENNGEVYVCSAKDRASLQKYLLKKKVKVSDREEMFSSQSQDSTSVQRQSVGPRVNMGRNTVERLEYHLEHRNDCDYSK